MASRAQVARATRFRNDPIYAALKRTLHYLETAQEFTAAAVPTLTDVRLSEAAQEVAAYHETMVAEVNTAIALRKKELECD